MKRILMAIMAVAVAVTFSAPAFAGDTKEEKEKKDKKDSKVLVYEEKKDDKKKDDKEKGK
jgi:Ni/Co efflux regulator RcnB